MLRRYSTLLGMVLFLASSSCAGQDEGMSEPKGGTKASIHDVVGAMEKKDLESLRESRPSNSAPELSAEAIRAIVNDLRRGSTYVEAARSHGATVGQAKSIERARRRRLAELSAGSVEEK